MNHCAFIICLVITLCFGGCTSLSTDSRLVGTFCADNSEMLAFMPDGRVFHTQIVNGKEERFFLGYYASSSSNPRSLGFVGPDTSPFVGTSFQANEDFSIVTARWENVRKPKDSWQITYRKTAKAN